MNANELANELETFDEKIFEHCGDKTQAINMQAATILRQQADRIAELEKQVAFLEDKVVLVDNTESQFKYRYLFGDDLLEAQKRINNMLRDMVDNLPNKDKP